MKRFCRSAPSLALFTAVAAHAQAPQVPNIGDAVRQSQPVAPPVVETPPLPALGNVPAEPPMQALPGGGATVQVAAFAIVGNGVIDTPTLQALVQPDQGKALTLPELDAIATRITHLYRARGYFVARAYIPAQEMTDATLTIRVVEGNYGRFVLANGSRVRDDIVQGLLDDIKDRDIVSLDTLERAMLVINDTPGVKVVRADVMPGEKVGTSDFAIDTAATPAADGYVLFDNYGSRYTGKERLSLSGDWNSPTGRGDRLSAYGMVTKASDLLNGRLAYSALVGTDGSRAEAALSRTTYQLGGVYAPLDAFGTADGVDVSFTKPLKRTRQDSVTLALGAAYKDLTDDVGSTDTHLRRRLGSVNAGLSERREHALFGLDGESQGSATLTAGRLHFEDATAAALDARGADTQGNYAKLNVAASRQSLLPTHSVLTTSLRVQAVLNHKNLDGVERMSVSGDGGVVAYAPGELNGDDAALVHADLSHPLPTSGALQLGVNAFADWGWAKVVSAPVGYRSSRELSDVGIGVSGGMGNGLNFRLQLAHRLGGAPVSEPTGPTRLLVQVSWAL